MSATELDELRIHAELFAAVVALERRIEAVAAEAGGGHNLVTTERLGLRASADPWLPFDASHWFARNPWYEA